MIARRANTSAPPIPQAAGRLHPETARPPLRQAPASEAAPVRKGAGARADLGNVLVLGLGKSGKSAARYVANLVGTRVTRLFIAAGERTDDAQAFLESIARTGVNWAFGDDALAGTAAGSFDLCIVSPGIPFWHDLYVAGERCSRELIGEVELAWRESAPDSTWIAITGTNGKTTTTALAAHVLRECGFSASAVGNIGDTCLDAVAAGKTQVYVAEVSSYQLYSTRRFAPDVAVVLNVTPDHVHWHRSFEAYARAKFNVLANLGDARQLAPPVAILDATDDVVRAKVRELRAVDSAERGFAYIPMGTADGAAGDMRVRCGAENAAFVTGEGELRVAFAGVEHRLGNAGDLQLAGAHNASNALAAAAVAVALGADDARVADALASFRPLEHRIEPCGSIAGVACYNDSKATNVDAALKALGAFPEKRVVVLLGGDDKGTDLSELASSVHARARAAVCFGAAAQRFSDALDAAAGASRSGLARGRAVSLEEALDVALALAEPGDAVLLSPACASFDEFGSFEERGRAFKAYVAARASSAGDGRARREEVR